MRRPSSSAFTLMEFLISVTITAILIALCIPTYFHYKRQFYYRKVVIIAESYRTAVDQCIQDQNGNRYACNAGQNNIPGNFISATGEVASVIVREGIITATPRAAYGINTTDRYRLTPKIIGNRIIWTATGEGCNRGYAQNC